MTDAFSVFEALRAGDAGSVRTAIESSPELVEARDESGNSLLMNALYHRQRELVEFLLGQVRAIDPFEAAALGRLGDITAAVGREPGLLTTRSTDGFTLLHIAAYFGHADLVRWMIRHGAPVDGIAGNPSLVRPLHNAVAASSVRIVELLLNAGAEIDAPQRGGWSALHAAAKRGDRDLIELLLERGATADLASADGRTARDLAIEHGHAAIVKRLSRS